MRVDIPDPVFWVTVDPDYKIGRYGSLWIASVGVGSTTLVTGRFSVDPVDSEEYAEDEDEVRRVILDRFGEKMKALFA